MAEAHELFLAGAFLHFLDEGRDVLDVADRPKHAQDGLVRAAVERTVERGGGGRDRRVWIGLRRAHRAHRVRRAVLLVVRVKDEENVERPLEDRVRDVPRLGHLLHHRQEIARVGKLVVRVDVREPYGMPVHEGRDRGHLRDEPDDVVVARPRVEDLLGIRVERRKRADSREQHSHRVGVVPETLHELLDVLVKVRVGRDVVREVLQLGGRRQFALQEEPGHLEKRRLLGELLDRVSPVFQDSLVAVDERDRRLARRRVREGGVVRHQAEIVLVGLDLAKVERPDRAVLDRQLVRLSGAVVGDRDRVFSGHDFLPSQIGAFRADSRPAPDRRDGRGRELA